MLKSFLTGFNGPKSWSEAIQSNLTEKNLNYKNLVILDPLNYPMGPRIRQKQISKNEFLWSSNPESVGTWFGRKFWIGRSWSSSSSRSSIHTIITPTPRSGTGVYSFFCFCRILGPIGYTYPNNFWVLSVFSHKTLPHSLLKIPNLRIVRNCFWSTENTNNLSRIYSKNK